MCGVRCECVCIAHDRGMNKNDVQYAYSTHYTQIIWTVNFFSFCCFAGIISNILFHLCSIFCFSQNKRPWNSIKMVENIDPTNNNQICDYIFTIRVAIVRIYRIYIYVVSGITGLVWLYSTLPSSAFLHSVMQTIRANEQKYRDELEHIPYTMRSKCINVYSQVKDEFWKSNILFSRTIFTVVSIFQYMICIMGFLSSFLMAAGVYSVSASWETIEHFLLEPNRMGEIPITNGSSRRSLTYT